jgi:hypothetical protein
VIREGRAMTVEALSSTEPFDADHESSPTSNNSPQVVSFLAGIGVRNYDYMTVRYLGHWGLVRGWKSLGYLCGDAARDDELAQRLLADRALRYDPAKDRDKLILAVKGSKIVNGLRRGFEYRLDVAADKKTKFLGHHDRRAPHRERARRAEGLRDAGALRRHDLGDRGDRAKARAGLEVG